ncbi:MAG: uncharacterized protein QOH46_2972, partial [Solirubrobacteraceae bacterium]|nr:uncharacterized protein [Solirubrobacteraceae bacterium]
MPGVATERLPDGGPIDRREPVLETVVTTLNADGSVNCGAMGVTADDDGIVIRPYRRTRTLRNLRARGVAVVNIVDDILLFVESAVGDPRPPTFPAASVEGAVVAGACSWREVRVRTIDERAERAVVRTRVVKAGSLRDFAGFNRAAGAVLEASILASRVRFLSADVVWAELDRLQIAVD